MKKLILLASAAVMAAFLACAKKENLSTSELLEQNLSVQKIILEGKEILAMDAESFIGFEKGGYFGFVGCNRFFGGLEYKQSELVFKEGGATKMLCPPEFSELEDALLPHLKGAFVLEKSNDGFVLKNANLSLYLKKN